jgi:peptide-methionine (S)-S-oxide reductase
MKHLRVLFSIVFLSVAANAAEETAVFAGGCFWGVEAVFEHVKGVKDVKSGYSGGTKGTANYDDVSYGRSTHAETVKITFDPAKVTYEQLLYIFFAVVHDPTEVDRQGPDTGPQYRSVIFYSDAAQKASAEKFIATINASKVFDKPVATQVVKYEAFYDAETEHQDFLKRNPTHPYIVAHDLPKLAALKEKFPLLYRKR